MISGLSKAKEGWNNVGGFVEMKLKYLLLLLVFLASSCAYSPPEPKVWMEKGTSLSKYKIFEVLPVQNETGYVYEFDVSATLRGQLIKRLRDKGYTVRPASPEEDALLIRSSIMVLEGGSLIALFPEASYCTVRTALIDNKTGMLLGDMVTSKEFRTGGLIEGGGAGAIGLAGSEPFLLDLIAEGIVNELEKRINQN